LGAKLTTLLCKKIIVPKSKEVKTKSSKEGYGYKRAVLPLMMMMMFGLDIPDETSQYFD
jgi:hypothetical protein